MKVYGRWNFILGDESYEWDPDQMLGSEWNQMGTDLGITLQEFCVNVRDRDFTSVQWLIWFLRRKNGSNDDRLGIDFPLLQYQLEAIPDPEDEAASEKSDAATSSTSSTLGSAPEIGTP